MAIRYVRFNVEALQRVAADAVDATRCTKMKKTHEGSYNKIFSLEFNNGEKVIAKIPTKLIPPFYTTASEVATMDFARTVLGLPVPTVLAWSARAHSTLVGAEFIIMRQNPGIVELRKRWDDMPAEDVSSVIDQVLHAERQFVRCRFSQIGSIYYVEDVEPELRERGLYADGYLGDGADRFRIGPSTEWALWRGARAELKVDRGPWPNVQSYIRGVVRIHQAWLADHARPFSVDTPPRQFDDKSPEAHYQLLEKLIAISSHVVPSPELSTPVLWHKDLHARNILVTDSSPPSITLIDWQSMSVGPLFQQATFPLFVQYHGDSRINLFNHAPLPDNFDTLSWQDKIYLKHQRRLAFRHLHYSTKMDPLSLAAQNWSREVRLRSAIDEASRTWDLGLGTLREHVCNLVDAWDSFAPGVACPILVREEEKARHSEERRRIQAYQDQVSRLYRHLETEGDGWVSNEHYEDARSLNEERRQSWNEAEAGGPYPIADGAPSWFVDP
ncbi:hypothetical protein BDV93DRAFT_525810 [Ceratobasidium sp. AG-I]|nr:hypothetical protein BDV93DRAFT_525810 [Ceratobasidium sp. AG-I]